MKVKKILKRIIEKSTSIEIYNANGEIVNSFLVNECIERFGEAKVIHIGVRYDKLMVMIDEVL